MGLIELCMLTFLAPQEPAPAPTTPVTPPVVAAPESTPAVEVRVDPPEPEEPASADSATSQAEGSSGSLDASEPHEVAAEPPNDPAAAEPDDITRLQTLETAGDGADPTAVAALTRSDQPQVAARAAWLLASRDDPAWRAQLADVVMHSPHAAARLQALDGLRRSAEAADLPTAWHALDDEDARVRTLAAQLLGKVRRPTSVAPLVGMVDLAARQPPEASATDVQAAMLTLADLNAADQLLRIATAIQDGSVRGTGTALTYCFQTLSPQLPADRETTLLIAVLDHREALLRRYAITRLAELGSPTAAGALEGRLAGEGPELRPLVEVALSQLRRDRGDQPVNEFEHAKTNALALWAKAKEVWRSLPPLQQGLAAATPVVLLLFVALLRRASRRRRERQEAEATAALAQPSEEYLEDEAAAAEQADYEDEYGDGDYLPEHDQADGFEDSDQDGADEELDGYASDTGEDAWQDDEEAASAYAGDGHGEDVPRG